MASEDEIKEKDRIRKEKEGCGKTIPCSECGGVKSVGLTFGAGRTIL